MMVTFHLQQPHIPTTTNTTFNPKKTKSENPINTTSHQPPPSLSLKLFISQTLNFVLPNFFFSLPMERLKLRVSPVFLAVVLIISPGPRITALGQSFENGDVGLSRCNADLNSFLPLPYSSNSSHLVCRTIWNSYILQYSQTQDRVLTIILSTLYTSGWVGIGFSKNGMMLNSSAMVGWINKEGEARIKQYHIKGFEPLQILPDRGELPLTNVPPIVVLQGANIYLAFQLKFADSLSRQPILLAFGSRYPTKHNHLSKHDDKATLIFDFSAGGFVSAAAAAPDNISHLKKTHGLLGLFGWGLVLPYGAIVARYLKHKDPLWYYLHVLIQFVGFLIVIAAVIVGGQLYGRIRANVPTHRGIGIFALVLSILQVLAFFIRPNKDSKIRKYWNWYHHWFGRIALFFGAVNIVLGIQIGFAGNEWKIGYGFLLASVLITSIVLEVFTMMRRTEQKPIPPPVYPMNPL